MERFILHISSTVNTNPKELEPLNHKFRQLPQAGFQFEEIQTFQDEIWPDQTASVTPRSIPSTVKNVP